MISFNKIDEKTITPIIFQDYLPRHHYSVSQIFFWVSLVLSASIGLRGSSRAMQIAMGMFDFDIQAPSWHAGRLWLMRLGYYKLNCPKEHASDWVWIVDHSVQIGLEKCLVILGVRLSNLPIDRALKFEDVEPIELIPVTKSNGNIVYEQLTAAKEKTGIPREIIADRGSDVKSGIDRFCDQNKETSYIYDIKHALAIMLEKEFEDDISWKNFITLCRETKQQIQQTELGALSPPNQRSKSRYMNVDVLISWGNNMNVFLNKTDEEISKKFSLKKVKEKFGWVKEYQLKIQGWGEMVSVISCAEDFVRKSGLYLGVHLDLEGKLNEFSLSDCSKKVKNNIIDFVKKESFKTKPSERLLGSSEIIESLFGKQKYIEKQQSKSGFTGLLLSIAAIVSKTTKNTIQKAMETIKTKTVLEWQDKNIGKSVQAKRIEAFCFSNIEEQKQSQILLGAAG